MRTQYVAIIDETLNGADLNTVSVKQVRSAIQARVQYDITPHKGAINDLVRERFDVVEAKVNNAEQALPSVETDDSAPAQTNGVHKPQADGPASPSPPKSSTKRPATSEELSDVIDTAPPKKKRKASVEDDAMLAARLQAEEDKMARPTRGGNSRKATTTKKKKTPKKKTSTKVTGSDDSDVNSEDKPKKTTGFHVRLLTHTLMSISNTARNPSTCPRNWHSYLANLQCVTLLFVRSPADCRSCLDPK